VIRQVIPYAASALWGAAITTTWYTLPWRAALIGTVLMGAAAGLSIWTWAARRTRDA
jgi:hypothetical protein